MITKFNYRVVNGVVSRTPDYSFTTIEELAERLNGITNEAAIASIAKTTLQGESERDLIAQEDAWFKVQTSIQDMDNEKASLQAKVAAGDKNGNPLNAELQKNIAARIAELSPGTITVKKVFYDHYTRTNMEVDETVQTPYTIALEKRVDLEASHAYLAGLRGAANAPARPAAKLDAAKEAEIRKELVRQRIATTIGDDRDLIADLSNVVSALVKKSSGQSVTAAEEAEIAKYVARQTAIAGIMAADYIKK